MLIALETAKKYLRVDSSDDDALIEKLTEAAEKTCRDIMRCEPGEDLKDTPDMEIAVLYCLAYLYEHREEADHHLMMITLRHLLNADRREVF